MEKFLSVLCMAVLLEGIVSYTKLIFVDKRIQWQVILAILLGTLLTIAYQLDMLAALGMVSTIPYVGYIVTGILISRGSNYLFDLIKTLQTFREGGKK